MVIKEKFTLLKNVPNIVNIPAATIKNSSIPIGPKKLFITISMIANRVEHFTKNKVIEIVSDIEFRKKIGVVILPDYSLHVSYNKPTKQMIINLNPFGVDDIYANDPDPKNIYACLVYAFCFYNLITEKIKVSESYAPVIISYLLSVFIRLFGKDFGLLGIYSSQINKLKFIIGCYIYSSFFGIRSKESYRKAGTISMYNYKEIEEKLDTFDFSKIEDFIKSLSSLGVMPGLNKYSFTHKMLKFMGISFLPAIEDLSRFISVITTSNITGSNIVPTFIYTYNEVEYKKLLELSKLIFR